MAHRRGFWGLSVVTAITSQSFGNAEHIEFVSEKTFISQLKIIFNSFQISAIKIGVLPKKSFAIELLKYLNEVKCPIVFDPVINSSSGFCLLEDEPKEIFNILKPYCSVITPNIPEFEYFFDNRADIFTLSKSSAISMMDDPEISIYLKGGHGQSDNIIEYLYHKQSLTKFEYEKKKWNFSRGTGCAFSSLLSMYLVENEMEEACRKAREELVEYFDGMNQMINTLNRPFITKTLSL